MNRGEMHVEQSSAAQESFRAVEWRDGALQLLDQRLLPQREEYLTLKTAPDVAQAIHDMAVRGAPAIGIAAAYGVVLAARAAWQRAGNGWREAIEADLAHLAAARPTAVNLRWAIKRMRGRFNAIQGEPEAALLAEARAIHDEDRAANFKMARLGAGWLPPDAAVLTHCNAGALATGGYGTALGVIRAAVSQGKRINVLADETRPFLQGARLTAWELAKDGIPVTVITDNMAGHFMKQSKVQAVIVGADRIAANGDVANKIGTYTVAVLARENGVPFYVAAPLSTIDLSLASGDEIPIEERSPAEVTHWRGIQTVPDNVTALHPAFDVTPHRYITAIITERGIAREPYTESLKALFEESGVRQTSR